MYKAKFNMDKKAMSPKAKGKSEAKVSDTAKTTKGAKKKFGNAFLMMLQMKNKRKFTTQKGAVLFNTIWGW